MKFLLLLAFLVSASLIPFNATAQEAGETPLREHTSIPAEAPRGEGAPRLDTASAEQEIALLRAQILLTDRHQESLLSVVLWSLAGIVGLAVLLSGFSWWTNFRLKEQDRKALILEIDQKAESIEKSAELAAVQSVARSAAEVRSEINALRDRVEKLSEDAAADRSNVKTLMSELLKQASESDVQLRLVEEYVWDTRDNQYNVLLTQVQGARSALLAENKSQAKLVLERMKNTLSQKIIPKGEKFSQQDIDFLEEYLKLLENVDAILVSEISSILAKTVTVST